MGKDKTKLSFPESDYTEEEMESLRETSDGFRVVFVDGAVETPPAVDDWALMTQPEIHDGIGHNGYVADISTEMTETDYGQVTVDIATY